MKCYQALERLPLMNSLLFLLFVSELQVLCQLLQALAVIQFNFAASSIELLKLLDERDLRLHANVQAPQLFVQLETNVCKQRRNVMNECPFTIQRLRSKRFIQCVNCDRIHISEQLSFARKACRLTRDKTHLHHKRQSRRCANNDEVKRNLSTTTSVK